MLFGFKNNRGKEKVYSADEVDEKIKDIQGGEIPTKTSQLENDSNFATTSQIPTKTSQLKNDSGFITSLTFSAFTTTGHELINEIFSPGQSKANTVTFSQDGYYPISISHSCNNEEDITLEELYISSATKGSVSVRYSMKNTSSGASYLGKLKCWVFWAK